MAMPKTKPENARATKLRWVTATPNSRAMALKLGCRRAGWCMNGAKRCVARAETRMATRQIAPMVRASGS